MFADIKADFDVARRRRPGGVLSYLFPNVFAVAMYRFAHALGGHRLTVPARAISIIAQLLSGAEIEWQAEIAPGLFLEHPVGVVIGPGVKIGANVLLGAGVLLGGTFDESRSRPSAGYPTLGDQVEVWTKASILGPIRIGDRAVIGAHALVLHDVADGAVARGVPAKSYVYDD